MIVNDASRIIIDNSRVMLQIAVSLTDNFRGVIYDHSMFKAQATERKISISLFVSTVIWREKSFVTFGIRRQL
jgi:hypothetical protein